MGIVITYLQGDRAVVTGGSGATALGDGGAGKGGGGVDGEAGDQRD